MEFLRSILGIVVGYVMICFLGSIWVTHKSYEFPLNEVESVAQQWSEGVFNEASTLGIRKQFKKKHELVLSREEFPPLLLSTGGISGYISLLYGSLSEFLILYEAPLQTSGFSGRHLMNMSITVLKGSVKVLNEKKSLEHKASTQYNHRIGERAFVELEKDTILLIYGRGLVPMTMGYWIWDSLLSSADPTSAFFTILYYLKGVYYSLAPMEFFMSFYDGLWKLSKDGLSYFPVIWNDLTTILSNTFNHIFKSDKSIMSDL